MKLRLTHTDLEDLTFEQKQNLCDLWIPHVFDAALASVCVDAIEEKYEQIAFTVGSIKLLKHNDIQLYDLKFLPDEQFRIREDKQEPDNISSAETEDTAVSDQSPEINDISGETDEDFSLDEDFDFAFQRPESYMKQDCVPLLDIGQMIDILQRRNFGECDFSLSITFGDFVCDIVKDAFSGGNFDINNKNSELCDILWEAVKALL